MRILPTWLREFLDLKVDERKLADDLTMAGIAVESVSGEGENTVFEMEITTNRVDAMNHYGVARECAALYDLDLRPLEANLPAAQGKAGFNIEIVEPELCARYTARILRGVKLGPSPAALQQRFALLDQRPINRAADATNYTLLEMGHPTHAFDLDLLEGGKIIVRRALPGEKLRTLDGVERTLHPDDLVIADAKKAVALAGVMGGFDTMITESTRNVLIESAWFDPVSVRRTARRHGLHTDASHRFERGADWGATPLACARVAALILASGGGTLAGDAIDAVARTLERSVLTLRRDELRRHLGQDIPPADVERILTRLGFRLTGSRGVIVMGGVAGRSSAGVQAAVAGQIAEQTEPLNLAVPTWRLDVEREIDLIEEVARVYGYNRFANTLPAFAGAVLELPHAARDQRLRTALLGLGYHEAVSVTFISRADAQQFSSAMPVALANPINEELTDMRTSLVPGMLNMLAWNLNRGAGDARLFEAGNVFALEGSEVAERRHLVLGATGTAHPASVGAGEAARAYSFFDLKGDIETLLEMFAYESLGFHPGAQAGYFHPGRSARAVVNGDVVARLGQLHPEVATARKLRQEVFLAEVYLDRLARCALRTPRYAPVPRFPAVERDFSFLFAESTTFAEMRGAVEALELHELRRFQPAEIFRGGAVPAGQYSVLLRATFQSAERTLRDDEVAAWAAAIIAKLEALGGKLRA